MELETDFLNPEYFKPIGEEEDLVENEDVKYKIKESFYTPSYCYSVSEGSHWFYENPTILEMNGIVKILYNKKYFQDNHKVAFEYIGNNKFIDSIKKYHSGKNKQFTATVRFKIIFGVATILKRLHKNNIILVDLIDSIYLDDKLEPKIEISSLSIVSSGRTIIRNERNGRFFESIYLLTPELFDDYGISFSNDVFSYAIFLVLIFMNNLYGMGKSIASHIKNIRNGKRPYLGEEIPPFYTGLIEKCWEQNPEERPTFEEITELLKNSKDARKLDNEKVNEDEFNEYVKRIESDVIEKDSKSSASENFYIDEEEELKYHTNIGQIGDGATSVTYKIVDTRNNVPICKKVLKYKNGQTTIKDAQNALKEFEVLHQLHHPCICHAIGLNIAEKIEAIVKGKKEEITTIAIFLEYEEYPLTEILKWNINNTFKTRIIVDIAHAMKFLHEKGMMHRDLKIENIMINSLMETKIVDFGYVKITEYALDDYSYVNDSLTKGIGTFAYMSPEMVNEEEYDNKTDVYSFGIILYGIFYGSLPKQSIKNKSNCVKIDVTKPKKPVTDFCAELISKCIEPNPDSRPSFEKILKLMRDKSFLLADDVDPSLIYKHDDELEKFESNK